MSTVDTSDIDVLSTPVDTCRLLSILVDINVDIDIDSHCNLIGTVDIDVNIDRYRIPFD